ncbi:MAG TPA: EamA family transporter [Bryobacteraceae bacterium]|nr:EamA family transporter [Bryobacteraceae bacterium]
MTNWLLVAIIVASTAAGDVLQSLEMKRHSEATVGRTVFILGRPRMILSVVCMAISFFAFMVLLSVADLSFAVPATAASFVVETMLAKYFLREHVDGRRWAGALLVAFGVASLAV